MQQQQGVVRTCMPAGTAAQDLHTRLAVCAWTGSVRPEPMACVCDVASNEGLSELWEVPAWAASHGDCLTAPVLPESWAQALQAVARS